MGNAIGAKKTTKVMKITGETMKLRTPVLASDVVRDYPGYVLLESEAVKHFGIRAKPLEAHQNLEPKRLYFLLELPEESQVRIPRRVRSGINMNAKDRLESLMLARRSVSDLSIVNVGSVRSSAQEIVEVDSGDRMVGGKRLTMRLPKAEVDRLMKESRDDGEAAEKIMNFYIANHCNSQLGSKRNHSRVGEGIKSREKRVSFLPVGGGDKQIVVAS